MTISNQTIYRRLLGEIHQEWATAEMAIKDAEQVCLKAVQPSISELRYAGRKLVEAQMCAPNDIDKACGLLRDARHDCARAQHDAIDTAVLTINLTLKNIMDRIPASSVLQIKDELKSVRAELRGVHRKIVEARKKREDRHELYKAMREVEFAALRDAYDDFKQSEEIMLAHASEERRKLIWSRGIAVASVFVGLLSIAVAILVAMPNKDDGPDPVSQSQPPPPDASAGT